MVYCGKPSKSCRQCRKRNIKCDKKTPACGQCLRACLQCAGYQNPSNLVFRNETETVIQRMAERKLWTPQQPIVPPILERAKHLFLSRHVYECSSNLRFLAPFRPPAPCDSYIIASAKAVMLACFYNEVKCPSVLQRARRDYSSALVLTNKALHTPGTVAKNGTIAAVLLLDLFEKFTTGEGCDNPPSVNHVQGAIAIFKLRDEKQFADQINISMFRYVSLSILFNCLRYGTQVPGDFIYLRNQACQYVNASDQEWQFVDLMVRLVQLKAALPEGSVLTNETLLALEELDDEYFMLLRGNLEYLYQDMSEEKSSYAAPNTSPSLCLSLEALGKKHVVLVRNLLDKLLQRNTSCQNGVET